MANPSALKVEGQRVTNPDGDGKVAEADAINYDNTTSGLAATDVQAAIDEIAGAAPDLASVLDEGNDADGNPITNLPAPSGPTEPMRLGDPTSYLFLTSTDTVTLNDDLYAGRPPGGTLLIIRFIGTGEKKIVFGTMASSVGVMILVYKSAANSSIVIEPTASLTWRGSSSPETVVPMIADEQSFLFSFIGNDGDFVLTPRINGAIGTALLADGAVTDDKIANSTIQAGKLAFSPVTGSFTAGQVPVASGTGSLTSNAGFTREVDGNGFDAFNLAQHTPDRDGPRVNVIGPNPAIHLKSPGGDFLASWQYFEGDSNFPSFSNIGSGFLSGVGFNAFGEWPEFEDVSTGCSVGVAPDDAVQFTIEDEASEAWAIEFASTDGRTVRTSVSIDVTAAGGDHHMIDVAVWAVKSAGAWSVSHTIVHDTSGGLIDIDVIDGEDNALYVVVSNDLGEDINAQLWIGGFFANMPAAPSA